MFIIDYLMRNGFSYTEEKVNHGEFTTLISDTGIWYSLKFKVRKALVTVKDSLKVLPMPVEAIPKAFGLPLRKLDLDYIGNREEGHVLTPEELEYLKNDVHIVGLALGILHNRGLKKLTTASNALNDYKDRVGKNFERWFPPLPLEIDKDCRLSYKGGWTYVNPSKQDKKIGSGRVYDINSAYPYVMRTKELPYGLPIYYEGKYDHDELYPLYIQCVNVWFKLKAGKYPSLQLKQNPLFVETEYITDSLGMVTIHLTSVDFDLMVENYDILDIEYINGYKFRGQAGMFNDYIDYWYGEKVESKKVGNLAYASIAKLMQNGLYGKFGTNPRKAHKIPYYDPITDTIKFKNSEIEEKPSGYVAVASFITSYVRDIIIRGANSCGERFCYADTDSLHIEGDTEPDIWIDEYELGAFKLEGRFTEAKYLRQKCYIETIDGKMDKKCAGLPKNCRDALTYDSLKIGQEFGGKLRPKTVPGGVVLEETIFKIRG